MADNRDHDADEDLTGAEEPEFDLFSDDQEDSFSDLDPDILDLSDEDVKEEIAALEREEFGFSNTTATPDIGDFDIADGDPNDNLAQADPNELPKAPPERTKTTATKLSKPAMGSELLAKVSALYAQSPRLIIAAVPAVLLPIAVVWFFLASDSDADRPAPDNSDSTVFLDPPREERLFSAAPESNNNAATAADATDAAATEMNQAAQDDVDVTVQQAVQQPAQNALPDASASLVAQATDDAIADSEPATASPATTEAADTALLAQQEPDTTDLSDYIVDAEAVEPEVIEPESAQEETDTGTTAETGAGISTTTSDADVTTVPPVATSEETETIPESEVTEVGSTPEPEADNVAAANSLPQTSGENFYHVIAGSLPTREDADAEAERLSDSTTQAYVIPPFGSSNNFRIAVAGFPTMTAAREAIPALRGQFSEGIWPLRYPPQPAVAVVTTPSNAVYVIVASLASEEAARGFLNSLDSAGNTPFILTPYAPANAYRVAIASFPTLSAAQNALPQLRQRYGETAWLLRY